MDVVITAALELLWVLVTRIVVETEVLLTTTTVVRDDTEVSGMLVLLDIVMLGALLEVDEVLLEAMVDDDWIWLEELVDVDGVLVDALLEDLKLVLRAEVLEFEANVEELEADTLDRKTDVVLEYDTSTVVSEYRIKLEEAEEIVETGVSVVE